MIGERHFCLVPHKRSFPASVLAALFAFANPDDVVLLTPFSLFGLLPTLFPLTSGGLPSSDNNRSASLTNSCKARTAAAGSGSVVMRTRSRASLMPSASTLAGFECGPLGEVLVLPEPVSVPFLPDSTLIVCSKATSFLSAADRL